MCFIEHIRKLCEDDPKFSPPCYFWLVLRYKTLEVHHLFNIILHNKFGIISRHVSLILSRVTVLLILTQRYYILNVDKLHLSCYITYPLALGYS